MANITIYTKSTCPFCVRAKSLLQEKGASNYEEIDITGNDDLRSKMIERANGSYTVPQIFINDYHVGGCDDLYALEEKGELTKLLA